MHALDLMRTTLEAAGLASFVAVALGLYEFTRRAVPLAYSPRRRHREAVLLAEGRAIAEAIRHGREVPKLDRAA